jgi:hypothetical protein
VASRESQLEIGRGEQRDAKYLFPQGGGVLSKLDQTPGTDAWL